MSDSSIVTIESLLRDSLEESRVITAVRMVDAVVGDYCRAALGSRRLTVTGLAAVCQAVRGGVPVAILQRSLWEAHLRLLDLRLNAGGALVRTEDLTSFTMRYCGHIAKACTGPDQREVLARLLDGDPLDLPEAECLLGIRFADHHWAAVFSPEPGGGMSVEDVIRLALVVVRELGGARPLVAVNDTGEVWMWTRWPSAPSPQRFSAVCSRLRVPAGVRIYAGPVASGVVGFRRSALVARTRCKNDAAEQDRWWCDYRDTSPVSLFTGDQQQAHWIIDNVLGELGSDNPSHATLRETLRLYLASGRSRQHVAEAMHINRNTVGYRLQKATQILGRPIDDDTFDVRLALEIIRTVQRRGDQRPDPMRPVGAAAGDPTDAGYRSPDNPQSRSTTQSSPRCPLTEELRCNPPSSGSLPTMN